MSAPARWLRFATGGLEAMVSAAAVRRTLPVPQPLPAVVELAGEPHPVVDLRAVAGASMGPEPTSVLLVIQDTDARLVLPATEVGGLVAAAPERIEPLPWPYDGKAAWCIGVMVPDGEGGRPVLVVDLAGLARMAAEPPARVAAEPLAREAIEPEVAR